MEITVKTMMIIVIGLITLVVILALIVQSSNTSSNMLDSMFGWFKNLIGG